MPTYSKETALYDTGAIAAGLDAAGDTADTYITAVDQNGITVHPARSNWSTNGGRTNINANGMTVYVGSDDVAFYGATARIGKSNSDRVTVDSTNGITIYKGNSKRLQTTASGIDVFGSDGTGNVVAQFGAEGATVGYADKAHTSIGADYFRMEDASGTPVIEVHVNNDSEGFTDSGITFLNTHSTSPFLVSAAHDIAEIVGLYEVIGDGTYGDLIEVPTFEFPGNYKVLKISTALTVGKTYIVKYKTLETIFDATLGTRATEADGWTYPTGDGSVVLGRESIASALGSFAAGEHVVSNFNAQAALGRYNAIDPNGDYALIVGNGTSDTARSNAFAVGWDGTLAMNGVPMADYIVEQGTSGIWTYRKWSSGIAECWGTRTASIAVSTAATGYGGYRSPQQTVTLPSGLFSETPCATGSFATSQGVWLTSMWATSSTSITFFLSCGSSMAAANRPVNISVHGRWS